MSLIQKYYRGPVSIYMYHSLAKELPWVEHLTSLPNRGLGALLSVSTFNHEIVYAYSDSLLIAHKFAEY